MEQMRSFKAPMKSRNPVLHFVFARMGLAEEQGYGLSSLKEQAEKHNLPLPTYSNEGDSLVLTIYRTAEGERKDVDPELAEALNEDELRGWLWLRSRGSASKSEYVAEMGVPDRTAQRYLKHLVELARVRRTGSGPATRYEAIHD